MSLHLLYQCRTNYNGLDPFNRKPSSMHAEMHAILNATSQQFTPSFSLQQRVQRVSRLSLSPTSQQSRSALFSQCSHCERCTNDRGGQSRPSETVGGLPRGQMQHFEPSEYYSEQIKPQQELEGTKTRSGVSVCDAAAPTADVEPKTIEEGGYQHEEACNVDELFFKHSSFLI